MSAPTINPTERRTALLVAFAEAKAAADEAVAIAAEAKAALLKACPEEGVLESDGFRATITVQARKDFNVDAAAELLAEEDFEAVTVRKIDTKAWSVLAARFPAKVIAKVVIAKPTTVITIKEV